MRSTRRDLEDEQDGNTLGVSNGSSHVSQQELLVRYSSC